MIAKRMGSPLGSPTLSALPAQFRNRLPTQLRRCLPLYLGCAVIVLVLFNFSLFRFPGPGPEEPSLLAVRPAFLSKPSPPQPKSRADFPQKIWQVWKVHPLAFEERDRNNARTWVERNPDWRYEVLTDANELSYVEYHFGPEGFNRPDIVTFYKEVKAAIVKADLLRYMIMFAEGGAYADIDVEALRPMNKFIPERYDHKDVDMVVGVEIDEPDWKDHPILGPKSRSFCQWTFMSKPQNPIMMRLIEQIMAWLRGVAEKQGVPLGEVKLDFDEIITGTGPSAFTEAITAEMNAHVPDGGRPVTWDDFHDLSESKVVSRVLVLTVEAFAAGQGHSDSGNHEGRTALVKHHYHASNWPSRHPRFKHPAYGEVEKCNWEDECVHKWDQNVANFEKLSKEEQDRIVDEKERERLAKEEEEKRAKEEEDARRKEEEAAERLKKEEEERLKKEEEARAKKERRPAKDTTQGKDAAAKPAP